MTAAKQLIVNADDLGQSAGVNRGIFGAVEEGIVTSASLMVRWPAAAEAAAWALQHARISIGLHIDLGEWYWCDDRWAPRYSLLSNETPRAAEQETLRQLDSFRRLLHRDPTHLDSHQHVHQREPARQVVARLATRLGVPLRHCDPAIRYCGDFYGQTAEGEPLPDRISAQALVAILETLPDGCTELGCHPGDADDLETTYKAERAVEAGALCHPLVRAAIAAHRIVLRPFGVFL